MSRARKNHEAMLLFFLQSEKKIPKARLYTLREKIRKIIQEEMDVKAIASHEIR